MFVEAFSAFCIRLFFHIYMYMKEVASRWSRYGWSSISSNLRRGTAFKLVTLIFINRLWSNNKCTSSTNGRDQPHHTTRTTGCQIRAQSHLGYCLVTTFKMNAHSLYNQWNYTFQCHRININALIKWPTWYPSYRIKTNRTVNKKFDIWRLTENVSIS